MAEEQEEKTPEVELGRESRQLLSNTESTVHSILETTQDMGDAADYTKMTVTQLRDEVRKMRREIDLFRFEIRKFIANEVEKQLEPINAKLDAITTKNPRIIYVKFKFPLFDIFGRMYAKLFKRNKK